MDVFIENPNAIHILEKNLNNVEYGVGEIDWKELSKNPNAMNLLEQNLDKIDWPGLSKNPNAIGLLEAVI